VLPRGSAAEQKQSSRMRDTRPSSRAAGARVHGSSGASYYRSTNHVRRGMTDRKLIQHRTRCGTSGHKSQCRQIIKDHISYKVIRKPEVISMPAKHSKQRWI